MLKKHVLIEQPHTDLILKTIPLATIHKPDSHSVAWALLTRVISLPNAQGNLVRYKPLQLSDCEQ